MATSPKVRSIEKCMCGKTCNCDDDSCTLDHDACICTYPLFMKDEKILHFHDFISNVRINKASIMSICEEKHIVPVNALLLCSLCSLHKNRSFPIVLPWITQLELIFCRKHSENESLTKNVDIQKIFDSLHILLSDYFYKTRDSQGKQCKVVLQKYPISILKSTMAFHNREDGFFSYESGLSTKTPIKTLIVGNVGSGKSYFTKIHSTEKQPIIPEDTEKWNSPLAQNILSRYSSSKENDLSFQWYLIADMLSKDSYTIQESGIVAVLVHIVAKTIQGVFTYDEFLMYAHSLSAVPWPNYKIIYLDISPEVCLERIKKRNKAYDAHFNLEKLKILEIAFSMVIPFFIFRSHDKNDYPTSTYY